jgi:hypothetical protein
MINYISSDNALSRLPNVIDATLFRVVQVYANGLTSAKLNDKDLPITVLAESLYQVTVDAQGELALTDSDETVTITVLIEAMNSNSLYSWLQRNQLIDYKDIFESKSDTWLKRFALFAKDINSQIGTYRAVDTIFRLLDIPEYKLEREWTSLTNPNVSVFTEMQDTQYIDDLDKTPTGGLKLSYSANLVIFSTEEVVKLIEHVLPAVNYIDDVSANFFDYTEQELYVASQETELSTWRVIDDSVLIVSDYFMQLQGQACFHVNCTYDTVLSYDDHVLYLQGGVNQVLCPVQNLEQALQVQLYMLSVTGQMTEVTKLIQPLDLT